MFTVEEAVGVVGTLFSAQFYCELKATLKGLLFKKMFPNDTGQSELSLKNSYC